MADLSCYSLVYVFVFSSLDVWMVTELGNFEKVGVKFREQEHVYVHTYLVTYLCLRTSKLEDFSLHFGQLIIGAQA